MSFRTSVFYRVRAYICNLVRYTICVLTEYVINTLLFSPGGLVPSLVRVADRRVSHSLSYIVCLVYTGSA